MVRWCVAALFAAFAIYAEAPKLRLPGDVKPLSYELNLKLDPQQSRYSGTVLIDVEVLRPVRTVWLNATNLTIDSAKVGDRNAAVELSGANFAGFTVDRDQPVGKAFPYP